MLTLWAELAPELDAYGGGGYDADFRVSSLLQEIAQALSWKKIDAGYRQQLLDNTLPYIESDNAGQWRYGFRDMPICRKVSSKKFGNAATPAEKRGKIVRSGLERRSRLKANTQAAG